MNRHACYWLARLLRSLALLLTGLGLLALALGITVGLTLALATFAFLAGYAFGYDKGLQT